MNNEKSIPIRVKSGEGENKNGQNPENEPEEVLEGSGQSVEERLGSLEAELKETHDKMLRALAERDNMRKRTQRELEEFRKYANEDLIKGFLPILDNLERAVESAREGQCDLSALIEGVELTRKEIEKLLDQYGVACVDAMGQPFDPCFHQALMQEESGEHPENTVVREMQKGYTMKERLLRPSLVVVSSGGPKKEGNDS